MKIETDEEFEALMLERFASKPYSNSSLVSAGFSEYWTDERYADLRRNLLETQRQIRQAGEGQPTREDVLEPDAWDLATAKWVIWSIQTHDVGATPTHWHRVWNAVRSVIMWTREDERRRIAEALRREQAGILGKTASELIESAILRAGDAD